MDVSVIIVNYNTRALTLNCIESIKRLTQDIFFEIILVDNASTDGSKEFFERQKEIKYIYSTENLGFGRANNRGVEIAAGEFLIFLNSDTLLVENSIKKLHDFFVKNEKNLKIGSLGCQLVDENGLFNGHGSDLPTCRSEIREYLQHLPIVKNLIVKNNAKGNEVSSETEYYPVGYVIGADLMMRKALFQNLHGFDPAYFMYYEESDLQFRMKKEGLEAYIYNKTKIIHLEDGSGKQIKKYNNRKRIIAHTSKNIYLKKNDRANFNVYKFWDKMFLFLNRFSSNYTKEEKIEFEKAVKKTY